MTAIDTSLACEQVTVPMRHRITSTGLHSPPRSPARIDTVQVVSRDDSTELIGKYGCQGKGRKIRDPTRETSTLGSEICIVAQREGLMREYKNTQWKSFGSRRGEVKRHIRGLFCERERGIRIGDLVMFPVDYMISVLKHWFQCWIIKFHAGLLQ